VAEPSSLYHGSDVAGLAGNGAHEAAPRNCRFLSNLLTIGGTSWRAGGVRGEELEGCGGKSWRGAGGKGRICQESIAFVPTCRRRLVGAAAATGKLRRTGGNVSRVSGEGERLLGDER
jgi:hypothetical protein